jgi:hypothetical protein
MGAVNHLCGIMYDEFRSHFSAVGNEMQLFDDLFPDVASFEQFFINHL